MYSSPRFSASPVNSTRASPNASTIETESSLDSPNNPALRVRRRRENRNVRAAPLQLQAGPGRNDLGTFVLYGPQESVESGRCFVIFAGEVDRGDRESVEHVRQPPDVVGVGVGGDEAVQLVYAPAAQEIYHFGAGFRPPGVYKVVFTAGLDEGRVSLADVYKADGQSAGGWWRSARVGEAARGDEQQKSNKRSDPEGPANQCVLSLVFGGQAVDPVVGLDAGKVR